MLLACLAMSLLTACASTSASDCAWVQPFILDDNFEHRWTRAEMEQVLVHNEAWERYCG